MTPAEFHKRYQGWGKDVDGVAGIQCVDLFKEFLRITDGRKEGGEAQHKLIEAEMPNHTHIEMLGDNSEPTQMVNELRRKQNGGTNSDGFIQAEYTSGLGDYVRTASTGGSQPHNNMPPYYSLPFWIRTA